MYTPAGFEKISRGAFADLHPPDNFTHNIGFRELFMRSSYSAINEKPPFKRRSESKKTISRVAVNVFSGVEVAASAA
jgi:hypothetical protein